jgi:hypothetical protein
MSRIVDNVVAMKIVRMLVTNFSDTKAFKLGIIDAHGNTLKPASTLRTAEEKEAFTYLDRLVFNMKKIINRLPGGESTLKSLVSALWLVKEYYESGSRTTSLMEERYKEVMRIVNSNVVLAEEQLVVSKVLAEEGMGAGAVGGAPTNNTSGPVATQEPKIGKKDIKKYQVMARRPAPVNK